MDFPEKRWVRVKFRNSVILGFAYVDKMAGPSIKGASVSPPLTPEKIDRIVNEARATVRVPPFPIPIEPLSEEEVRQLGLPTVPSWYTEFFERNSP